MTLTAVISETTNSLHATINTRAESITATLDPYVIQKARIDLYELAKQKGFTGTFDEFLGSIVDIPDLISADAHNDLKLGSDNKLVSQPNDINFLAYYILAKG